MKKNVMMRIASVLLIAVLISTSAISGTYAKYVTSGSGSDSARVARFGVKVVASGSTFATEYAADDTSVTLEAGSVFSAYGDDVVAPGTKGDMSAISMTGVPEVAVNVTYAANVDLNDNWKDSDGNFYCPLVIYVNGNPIYGLGFDSADAFEAAIMNIIKDYSKVYEANTILASEDVSNENLTISWEWPFEGTGSKAQTDEKDTYLGDQAALGNYGTISIEVTCTVTQID